MQHLVCPSSDFWFWETWMGADKIHVGCWWLEGTFLCLTMTWMAWFDKIASTVRSARYQSSTPHSPLKTPFSCLYLSSHYFLFSSENVKECLPQKLTVKNQYSFRFILFCLSLSSAHSSEVPEPSLPLSRHQFNFRRFAAHELKPFAYSSILTIAVRGLWTWTLGRRL